MGVRVTDNGDIYVKGLVGTGLTRREHSLTFRTTIPYAPFLQDRHGYHVFRPTNTTWDKNVRHWIIEVVEEDIPLDDRSLAMALDGAGFEEVNHIQSLVSQMRPPVRAEQGLRQAHPGGWADISGNLAGSIEHSVNDRRFQDHPYTPPK